MILSSKENVKPEQKPNSEQQTSIIPSPPAIGNTNVTSSALSETYLMDCIEGMKHYPDKWFDLAVVDPPYGIDAANLLGGEKRKSGKGAALKTAFTKKEWDLSIPTMEYFVELFRVSKNQIIWGANYMVEYLPASMGWLVWDKNNGTTKFSDCELAFTSYKVALRKFRHTWNGMLQENMKDKEMRIHPTQKPIALYDYCFQFANLEPGMKVIDTHLGSGSSRIAAHKNKLNFVGFEIDKEYFDKQEKRFADYVSQLSLF